LLEAPLRANDAEIPFAQVAFDAQRFDSINQPRAGLRHHPVEALTSVDS
jgi:hypothetical protein